MPGLLYLDTARLGLMSPTAQLAHADFGALAATEGATPRFERFVACGEPLPPSACARYQGIAGWRGPVGLKSSLRDLAGADDSRRVLLAARSAQLMAFAARLLSRLCRNVLATDLGWPPYRAALERECLRAGRSVTTVPLREALYGGQAGDEEVAALVCRAFAEAGCDGLFLTEVSHLGARLPVERIAREVEARRECWFTVVDGAQAFCHTREGVLGDISDLYLAGCHKWLGACHPMGFALYGRRRSLGIIETTLEGLLDRGDIDDPLLRFTGLAEGGGLDGWSETVGLAPLFAAHGAARDALDGWASRDVHRRLASAGAVASAAPSLGWLPLLPPQQARTGILLLQAEREEARGASAEGLRAAFGRRGVALTAYDGGIVRLSMPAGGWGEEEAGPLREALLALA